VNRWFGRARRAISMGDLRRLEPVSRVFGADRGTTIRRAYIERFLDRHRADLRGRILEIGDSRYAREFGATGAVIDVLDPDPANAAATIHGDLVAGDGMPDDTFDAAILTQVLHVLPDMEAALRNVHRALKAGGVLVATIPGITQVSRYDMDRWGDFWRVTDRAARLLIERYFPHDQLDVAAYGNHITAIAALTGLAAEELSVAELGATDPDFQVLIGVRARKTKVSPKVAADSRLVAN
jgi:SAM-dependent methyltransferase